MRQPRVVQKDARTGVVVDFPEGPSSTDIQALVGALSETNKLLAELAGHANDTLTFFKRYVPWAIAGLAVAYPTVGKIINGLPPLPH